MCLKCTKTLKAFISLSPLINKLMTLSNPFLKWKKENVSEIVIRCGQDGRFCTIVLYIRVIALRKNGVYCNTGMSFIFHVFRTKQQIINFSWKLNARTTLTYFLSVLVIFYFPHLPRQKSVLHGIKVFCAMSDCNLCGTKWCLKRMSDILWRYSNQP